MRELKLPRIKIGRSRYNCLVWRRDDPHDDGSPMRVYLRMDPAVEQWFADNNIPYAVAFRREPKFGGWYNSYQLIIEDPGHVMLFKLTWM